MNMYLYSYDIQSIFTAKENYTDSISIRTFRKNRILFYKKGYKYPLFEIIWLENVSWDLQLHSFSDTSYHNMYIIDLNNLFLPHFLKYNSSYNHNVNMSRCFPIIRECLTGEKPNFWREYERTKIKSEKQRIFLEKLHRNNQYNNYYFYSIINSQMNYFHTKFIKFDFSTYKILYYSVLDEYITKYLFYHRNYRDFYDNYDGFVELFYFLSISFFSFFLFLFFPKIKYCRFLPIDKYLDELEEYEFGRIKSIKWSKTDIRKLCFIYFEDLLSFIPIGYDQWLPVFYYLDCVDNLLSSNSELSFFFDYISFYPRYVLANYPNYPENAHSEHYAAITNYENILFRPISSPNFNLHYIKSLFYTHFSIIKMFLRLRLKKKKWKRFLFEFLYFCYFNNIKMEYIINMLFSNK